MKQALQFELWRAGARIAGWLRAPSIRPCPSLPASIFAPSGISVVIPSRSGRSLLTALLPGLMADLLEIASEVIVVDNGSDDATAAWLAAEWPRIQVVESERPLSFAAAVNRGIARARYSHVCLLNNDMLLEPGFFHALQRAFHLVPDLFCATAQIRFPAGIRREETGKAVMAHSDPDDFPLRCEDPLPGEDLTYVLYGSGGCSLYDAAKLRAIGGVDQRYSPAYVEDLDLGYRAWQCGWPSVYVDAAVVEHRHRATTSRYYTEAQLSEVLEVNYLRFLAGAVAEGALFRKLWNEAIERLYRRRDPSLRWASGLTLTSAPYAPRESETDFLALTNGDVAVFPGKGGHSPLAVEVDRLETPSIDTLAAHCEVVQVRRGNAAAMRAAKRWTAKRWDML